MAGRSSPDGVSCLDESNGFQMLPETSYNSCSYGDLDSSSILQDPMYFHLGRVLEDYPDSALLSTCVTPRSSSPWTLPQAGGPAAAPSLNGEGSAEPAMFLKPKASRNGGGQEQVAGNKLVKSKPTKKRVMGADGSIEGGGDDNDAVGASSPSKLKKKKKLSKNSDSTGSSKSFDSSSSMDSVLPPSPSSSSLAETENPSSANATSSAIEGMDGKDASASERSRKSSSTYRGVSLCTKDSRWQARIRIRKEVVYLGRFESEEDAAKRYDEAAREHHGDKALINFITPEDRALGRKCVFEQVGGKSARI